ncbi:MAG TPA: AMMECR1 domain-containing protein [Geobacteraceae bacterium]|nr:AMMECR1 domain-containing protein [Geobacteraceae bacterium]
MKSLAIALIFCLLLSTGELQATPGYTSNASGSGISQLRDGTNHPASFFDDNGRTEELLNYAKGAFLARLGFSEPVIPPEFLVGFQHACFVTFFSGKKVIACFGGFYPRTGNVAGEIAENIRMALLFDPRARSIVRKTAQASDVQVTFPGEPVPVKSYAEINPLREGMLVENDRHGVAIVPGEAKTASWAFREAMRRLGEKDPASLRIFKFQAWTVSTRTQK